MDQAVAMFQIDVMIAIVNLIAQIEWEAAEEEEEDKEQQTVTPQLVHIPIHVAKSQSKCASSRKETKEGEGCWGAVKDRREI